jgi:hypothetical protein
MKHIIWSDMDVINDESLEYAKETLLDCYEEEEITDDRLEEFLYQDNSDMFDYEVDDLSSVEETAGEIIAIADMGLWNGRRTGYKLLDSRKVSDCLTKITHYDFNEFYVDEHGELRSTHVHHDGTNHVLYRSLKPELTYEQVDEFTSSLYYGKEVDIDEYTDKVGTLVAKFCGWDVEK